jgi:hypothetical protein
MYISTLSLTSELEEGGWLKRRPGRFTPWKETPCTHCTGGWEDPRAALVGCGKSRSHFSFVFSCTLYFIHTCAFVLIILHFCLSSLLKHTIQTSMPPSGFEPAIPASERPQAYALDRAATGIGGIRSPDHPARSESLHLLSYGGPLPFFVFQSKILRQILLRTKSKQIS